MIVIDLLTLLKFPDRHRRIVFVGALLLVSAMQWTCLRHKVSYVEPGLYRTSACELQVTPKWRYGFIRTYHGAHLVRTPNVPLQLVEHAAEADEQADGTVMAGPSALGAFVRLTLNPARTPTGPPVAPLAAAFYRFADRHLGTAVGPLGPATACRGPSSEVRKPRTASRRAFTPGAIWAFSVPRTAAIAIRIAS